MKPLSVLFVASGVIAILGACPPVPAQAQEELIAGRRIAEEMCAKCHAIHDYQTASPVIEAPNFQKIANDPGKSAQALTGWLQSSHPAMPNVMLSAGSASDVIDYLLSLRQW